MLYPALPPLGFIAAILALIPLPRQIRVCNVATIALSWWLFGTCVIQSVNAIVWDGNVNNPIPVWCDITSRFLIAANFGLPAATFCVCKHLEHVASGRSVISGASRSRRIVEVIMCFIIPCFWIFVVYCFQTSRFIIVENFGCYIQAFNSYVTDAVWQLPPLLLSAGTLLFGCAAIYHLIRNHRMNTAALEWHLMSRNSPMSSVQYCRLMAMSITLGIWGIGWISYYLKSLTTNGNDHLPSWKVIHSNHSTIVELPAILMTPGSITSQLALWWGLPGGAYLYFLLFGTSREVLSDYQRFWVRFRTRVLMQAEPANSSMSVCDGSPPMASMSTFVDTITIDEQVSKLPKEELSSAM